MRRRPTAAYVDRRVEPTTELAVFGRDGGPWFAVPVAELERFRLPDARSSDGALSLIDRSVRCAWVNVPVSLLDKLYGGGDE